jgi:hypothetical protein
MKKQSWVVLLLARGDGFHVGVLEAWSVTAILDERFEKKKGPIMDPVSG